ncbi:MAG TPA: polysaccharide deacetylase family protein [Cerasibacillus sp.]|uniref:polysaccharide deacetylase family protein n=1 Tax=Cerasibacillus sp. TaxID=2498711 RepID=UPI002F421BA4
MIRWQQFAQLFLFILLVILTWKVPNHPFIKDGAFITVSKQNDSLYKEIEQKAKQYDEKPEDAYIDDVWKKTPGRNGVKVNINKSYKKMMKKGMFDESYLVFDEIPPQQSLKDLAASPIYRGHPKKEMVAFLINVSWGTEHVPKILHTLKNNHVKATFFIEGKWAKEHVDYVRMIAEQGHTIGNHAYNHPDMARMSKQEIESQIVQTNEILHSITEKEPKWFAPPSGSYSNLVVATAHQLKMETILWTVDTIDWKKPSVSVMLNRVMNHIHPGATILMHPTPVIENGLEQLIELIKAEGYRIGTIDELLSEKR